MRNCVEKVIEKLEQLTYTRKCYDNVRWFNFDRDELDQKAADFIYCNKVGFNVPFGKYTNPNFCNKELLREASKTLMAANLLNTPFWEAANFVKENDLVYFDPPYVPVSETSNFTNYSKDGFTMKDQIRLRDVALDLKNRGAHVILSNSSSPIVYELYKEFHIEEVKALRSINSSGEKRGAVTELLIY